jgi:hypothetical protein
MTVSERRRYETSDKAIFASSSALTIALGPRTPTTSLGVLTVRE